jgi:hypothetical protein
MTLSILTPEGPRNLILRGIRTPDGNKAIVAGSITTPGGSLQFWDGSVGSLPAVTVNVEPPASQGAMASPALVTVNTEWVTASASGGSAPYSYVWTVEDDGGFLGWQIVHPDEAATYFRAVGVDAAETWQATMRCTATDARGATGFADIQVIAQNYGSL